MMKTEHSNKRASDTILYSYLICAFFAACAYFAFEGKYFELCIQIAILVFLFTCTITAIKTSSMDSLYLPPAEIGDTQSRYLNKRWKKCIDWWNSLPEDELMINIRKLKTMNKKNADTLLKAFEQLELFEKCSIIKKEIN